MGKVLVAFFSATGKTKTVAENLAKAIDADLYEIVPEEAYTKADLNWMDENSRSSVEMKVDTSIRPAIGSAKIDDIGQYDVIFLGFPIWWYKAPTIVNTFLEGYDLAGKKIVLFATSGSSGIGGSADGLKASAPGAEILDGEVIRGWKSEGYLKAFAEKFL